MEFEKKYTEILESFSKVNRLLDVKDNQIQTIENFIEKYVPIRVQSQISELLGEIMSGK